MVTLTRSTLVSVDAVRLSNSGVRPVKYRVATVIAYDTQIIGGLFAALVFLIVRYGLGVPHTEVGSEARLPGSEVGQEQPNEIDAEFLKITRMMRADADRQFSQARLMLVSRIIVAMGGVAFFATILDLPSPGSGSGVFLTSTTGDRGRDALLSRLLRSGSSSDTALKYSLSLLTLDDAASRFSDNSASTFRRSNLIPVEKLLEQEKTETDAGELESTIQLQREGVGVGNETGGVEGVASGQLFLCRPVISIVYAVPSP